MELHAYVHHREPSRPKTIVSGTMRVKLGWTCHKRRPYRNSVTGETVSAQCFGTPSDKADFSRDRVSQSLERGERLSAFHGADDDEGVSLGND